MAGLVIFLLILATWVWVALDANKRDWSQTKQGPETTVGWIISVVFLWIIFFPLYVIRRREAPLLSEASVTGSVPSTAAAAQPRFKTCPDCAETVLADARVCKHGHYRFDQDPTEVT
jgi:hypothetical protein